MCGSIYSKKEVPLVKHARYVLAASLACGCCDTAISADRYPQRPVRMLSPYAPGGTTDIAARVAGQHLAAHWKQSVVIDNRLGAGGNIANELVAKAAPDGYTLLCNTAAIYIAPSIYKNLPFDPIRDFIPISKIGFSPAVVLLHPRVNANSISELVALAKAQPGKLNYGSAGTGVAAHLATELFKTMANVNLVHIPYKGGSPALTDLMGGQIQILFNALGTALPLAKSGRVKALAVTTAQRSQFAPDMPTVAESGVPGYEFSYWYALFAPAKTPIAVVGQINRDLASVVATPAAREQLEFHGVTPATNTLAEFSAAVNKELQTWARVAQSAGIQPQ